MWIELAALAYLTGSYFYHRWFDDPPKKPPPARQIEIPRTDPGAALPLIFGRCRVRSPWLAFIGTPVATRAEDLLDPTSANGSPFLYSLDMFFVMGFPFHADADNHLHHLWVDDFKMRGGDLGGLRGDGTDSPAVVDNFTGVEQSTGFIGGEVEFYNGNSLQNFCSPSSPFAAVTNAGALMKPRSGSGQLVPSFRNYMSMLCFSQFGHWDIGVEPRPGAYSMECSSYPTDAMTLATLVGEFGEQPSPKIGDEMNPVDALAKLITGSFGALNMPNQIDLVSFAAAARTVAEEANGYSCPVDKDDPAQAVGDILRQIDGILYEDPDSGTFKLKLVRADYNPALVVGLAPSNTKDVQDLSAGSRFNIPNKIRLTYPDRAQDYRDNSISAQNQANGVGMNGIINELVLHYPGVCTEDNARAILTRELSARSRPLAKFRALVDRRSVSLNPGDVIALTWPELGASGDLFRIAAIDRGTRESAVIKVDLIQEFYFTHRGTLFGGGGTVAAFPTGGSILISG